MVKEKRDYQEVDGSAWMKFGAGSSKSSCRCWRITQQGLLCRINDAWIIDEKGGALLAGRSSHSKNYCVSISSLDGGSHFLHPSALGRIHFHLDSFYVFFVPFGKYLVHYKCVASSSILQDRFFFFVPYVVFLGNFFDFGVDRIKDQSPAPQLAGRLFLFFPAAGPTRHTRKKEKKRLTSHLFDLADAFATLIKFVCGNITPSVMRRFYAIATCVAVAHTYGT